jgi:hypothetical protein
MNHRGGTTNRKDFFAALTVRKAAQTLDFSFFLQFLAGGDVEGELARNHV